MSTRFVHLHLHSEYSLADSTIRIPELVARCAALGQPAVALTDRNNLFALVKFYKAAEAAGIKPVAGADVSVAGDGETPWQLTLLCRDHSGYLSLSRLLTQAWMHGQRHDGVVLHPDWLRDSNAGLFALAGRHSLAGRLAAGGRHDQAEQWLADWQRHTGERLHLELTRTQREGEEAFNAFALSAAATHGIPVIASNDVRFLDAEGFDAHEARVCIASGRVLDDPKRPRDYHAEQSLKSTEAMAALFTDVPDAIDNALALATRCNLELALGKYHLPAFPVPAQETLESWIRSQAHAGLARRLDKHPPAPEHGRAPYELRLDAELDVIIKMGFPGYFLIVADFINWAKDHGIPVGPGRGSGAGSLVAWALGITDLDPLPYDLLFERFLNPERVSMPDFDIDFCMDRRDEVIDYVAGKYGRDRVSQIITYGTMAAKAVVRDAGRVLGYPYGFVDGIAKLIPLTLGISLDDALGESGAARKNPELASAELIQRYQAEDDVRDLLTLARKLEDLIRNAGKHAGGVVIAPSPLSDFCPLFAEHDGHGGGRNPVTQFDKDDVETIGLVKFDFLGLRTLTIIDWAVKAINAGRRRSNGAPDESAHDETRPLDITALPLDDPQAYALFARGETVAVFQFESRGMRELLKRARPDRFEDLIALVSLFRPGPMDLIPDYIERKHGAAVSYLHPALEPVLAPTYGVIVYQEQVMQIAQLLAGYSLGGADLLRRAMGKKDAAKMAQERAKFEVGALEHGVDPRLASQIFDLMEKFAGYGFNKSHAAAYALIAYQTAWLKVHYPAQFMAAVLSSDMDNTDKVVGFLDEARALGLSVLPPDVNASNHLFDAITLPKPDLPIHGMNQASRVRHMSGTTRLIPEPRPSLSLGASVRCSAALPARHVAPDEPVADATDSRAAHPCAATVIRYGLGAVKGVGRGACEAITAERERGGGFVDLLDFCKRIDSSKLNRRTLEALVQAGALDALGPNRPSLLLQLPEVLKATEQLARERDAGQNSLFGGSADSVTELQLELPKTGDWPLAQQLAGERDTLGHYLSGHPLDPYREELRSLVGHDLGDIDRLWSERPEEARRGWRPEITLIVAGQVTSMRRKGDSQAFVQLEDGYGRIECSFYSEFYQQHAQLLTRDRILIVEGGLREDDFNGGFQVRARRCWDFHSLCPQAAQRLSLRLDLRVPDVFAQLDALLARHRPGNTPLRLDLLRAGAAGTLELNGSQSVRVDAELIGALRAQPGVRAVKVAMAKPW